MAVSQRYVSAPPWPTEKDSISQVFKQFYDHKGPREAFRQEWKNMTHDERQALRNQMEQVHEALMSSFKAMPSQLMLIFRYLVNSTVKYARALERV